MHSHRSHDIAPCRRRLPAVFAIAAVLALCLPVCVAAAHHGRPKIHVEADGFPTGHATPEGVASDFARAFVQKDGTLLTAACLPPFGDDVASKTIYAGALERAAASAARKQTGPFQNPDELRRILNVAPAHALPTKKPAAYARATFGFRDVKYVDVRMQRANGRRPLTRLVVVQDSKGLWYVDLEPTVYPQLSEGLYDQPPSEQVLTDVYTVVPPPATAPAPAPTAAPAPAVSAAPAPAAPPTPAAPPAQP